MQVDFAMLALGADHSSEGLLHVFGGGFDSLIVDSLPTQLTPFFVVLRLTEENVLQEVNHALNLVGINPDGGTAALKVEGMNFRFVPTTPVGGLSKATLIIQVFMVAKQVGKYELVFSVDGREIKRLFMNVLCRND